MARGSLAASGRLQTDESRGGKGRARAQEILDAAVETFHARGYAATSVDDIASASGILKGSLYYYMDSKEDLLARIVEEVHEDVEAIIAAALARTELPPLERLATYLRAQVSYNVQNIKRVRVYYHDYDQLGAARLAVVRRSRRANEGSIVALIAEARRAGELPAASNERLAAKNAFAAITWMYSWYQPGGDVPGPEFSEFCARFVIDGLRAAGAAR